MPTTQEILSSMLYVGAAWQGTTLTYSIPKSGSIWTGYQPDGEPFRTGYATLTTAQAELFRTAIAVWDRLIAIDFVEVVEPAAIGDVRIAFTSPTASFANAGAWANIPPTGTTSQYNGDIWVNASLGLDKITYTLLVHELGHVLGLRHPTDPGTLLPAAFRKDAYSFMSANGSTLIAVTPLAQDPKLASISYQPLQPKGPGIYDILALQSVYGADLKTESGDTVYIWKDGDTPSNTVYDAGGNDTFDASGVTRASIIDLTPGAVSSIGKFSLADQAKYWIERFPNLANIFPANHPNPYTWTDNVGIAFSTVVENAIGGRGGDTITGNSAANQLTGNGGDDSLNGGAGYDTAIYSGKAIDYSWSKLADGSWTVKDLRSGTPDGTDTLHDIEILRFSDKILAVSPSLPNLVETAFSAIMRASSSSQSQASAAANIMLKLASGQSESQVITEVIKAADQTTSVATLSYLFFTGKIPSAAGIDYLVSPTGPNGNNLNSAYYQSFNLENRYINFAVNLGKIGEGAAKFTAEYGSLSLFEATRKAYATIFGGTPTDAKVSALLSGGRDLYFDSYGKDGLNGIGTKAAMVGWLLAEAEKADVGVMARSNAAWLNDLSDGSAPFAVDILAPSAGYYKADFIFGGS